MSNNAEYIIFTEDRLRWDDCDSDEEWGARLRELGFRNPLYLHGTPSLVISREVLPEEIEAGLDLSYRGFKQSYFDSGEENTPEVTHVIDELYKLMKYISLRVHKMGMTPEKALEFWLCFSFYDCMSSGASSVSLAMVRKLIQDYGFDLDEPRIGFTFRSFLEEIENIPQITKQLPANLVNIISFDRVDD